MEGKTIIFSDPLDVIKLMGHKSVITLFLSQ
jgi:hypothetical protein